MTDTMFAAIILTVFCLGLLAAAGFYLLGKRILHKASLLTSRNQYVRIIKHSKKRARKKGV
ncbi:hypothetical protein CWE15_03680 [Aliidiomarina taiwanensis]|uniref:Uncharacterized protein n=1 Tax=Aliidiomarina taiwanensis TaxID=946228 RepID=A0A432XAL5_9GAMM|nr:hypothetical protein CWE15_03680 [Aliidiomarina taiwanensis]